MKARGGYAMVMVLCVLALVTALCLSLLVSSAAVLSAARKDGSDEQCRLLALSLSRELEQELVDDAYRFDSREQEEQAMDTSLWFYVKKQISEGLLPYYNENERGHGKKDAQRSFTFVHQPEILRDGTAQAVLYWQSEEGAPLNDTSLLLRVTCTLNGQSSTVTSEYRLELTPNEEYYGNNATDTEEQQPYVCWQWRLKGRDGA